MSIIGSISFGFVIYKIKMLATPPPIPEPDNTIPLANPFLLGKWLHAALSEHEIIVPLIDPNPKENIRIYTYGFHYTNTLR